MAAATSYRNPNDTTADPAERCETVLQAAAAKTYRRASGGARRGPSSAFSGECSWTWAETEAARQPTDERLEAVRKGAE